MNRPHRFCSGLSHMLKSLFIGGTALVLSSCNSASPGFSTKKANFSEPSSFSVLNEKFSGGDQFYVTADITNINRISVNSGKLFIGDKVFSDGQLLENVYAWYVAKPCQNLPQGDNINIRYELYDVSGVVLQKSAVPVVTKINTC